MERIYGSHKEVMKRQLLVNISEILAQKGLLSEEEKNRMKVIVSKSK